MLIQNDICKFSSGSHYVCDEGNRNLSSNEIFIYSQKTIPAQIINPLHMFLLGPGTWPHVLTYIGPLLSMNEHINTLKLELSTQINANKGSIFFLMFSFVYTSYKLTGSNTVHYQNDTCYTFYLLRQWLSKQGLLGSLITGLLEQ